MKRILTFLVWLLVLATVGCSATSYQVQVSYSPVKDFDLSAKVFGN